MDLDKGQLSRIRDICYNFNIRVLAIFGSAVNGTPRDIDFAVFPNLGSDSDKINKLQLITEFESLFQKRADIIIVHSGTSTTLLHEICSNSQLIYEDSPGSFENERSIAFRKYADTYKFRRQREKISKNLSGA